MFRHIFHKIIAWRHQMKATFFNYLLALSQLVNGHLNYTVVVIFIGQAISICGFCCCGFCYVQFQFFGFLLQNCHLLTAGHLRKSKNIICCFKIHSFINLQQAINFEKKFLTTILHWNFSNQQRYYNVVTDMLEKYKTTRNIFEVLKGIASPGIVIPTLLLLL